MPFQNPISQINMRDARVEEVEKVSDSEGEDTVEEDATREDLTIGIFPSHQGPTYLIMPNKQEKVRLAIMLYILCRIEQGILIL